MTSETRGFKSVREVEEGRGEGQYYSIQSTPILLFTIYRYSSWRRKGIIRSPHNPSIDLRMSEYSIVYRVYRVQCW